MFFKKKKNLYGDTAKLLVESGYSDEYLSALDTAIEAASKAADIAEGMCYKACAHLFRGELDNAYDVFFKVDGNAVPKLIRQSFSANFFLCLFLLNKFREADDIYELYNSDLLNDHSILMRRSVGIHQFIRGNFDAALTVFIKAEKEAEKMQSRSDSALMLDICIVRTLMKLDMYSQAADYSASLAQYEKLGKLGDIVRKMKKTVFDKVSKDKKVKMIKGKKH